MRPGGQEASVISRDPAGLAKRRGKLMDKAILLAVAASVCTATASLCQREGAQSIQAAGFDARLLVRLARRPAWLPGIAAMIGGFIFQITALRYGDLALVQPILAAELLFVFGYLAIAGTRRVTGRDLLAAAAMSAGLGVFLRLAAPSGGRLHAPGSSWLLAGLVIAGLVAAALAVASGLGRRPGASRGRRAAVLGAATGISWGFMAAVIKELSAHLGGGPGAVFSTWSLYVLIAAGAVTMLLASHALAAGPLAASQPGFTILDPLAASLLGVFLFGERVRTDAAALAGQALALAVVVAGAAALSRSSLIAGENASPACEHQAAQAARPAALTLPGRPEPGTPLASDEKPPQNPGTRRNPKPPTRQRSSCKSGRAPVAGNSTSATAGAPATPAVIWLATASGGGLVEADCLRAAAALDGLSPGACAGRFVERGLGGVPALAAVLAPESLAVGQDSVDLPPLAARGALDPELVLSGVAAGGVPFIDRSQAGLGEPGLLGVNGVGAVDFDAEVVQGAALARVLQQDELEGAR